MSIKKTISLFTVVSLCILTFNSSTIAETCRDIYCTNFDFICCCSFPEDADYLEVHLYQYYPDNNMDPVSCPDRIDVEKCEFKIYNYGSNPDPYWIGKGENCVEETAWWGIQQRWKCEPESQETLYQKEDVTIELEPGDKIYIWSTSDIRISQAKIYEKVLSRTGDSIDCSATHKIVGSEGCEYHISEEERMYDMDNQPLSEVPQLDIRQCFSVPGERFQCDDTCNQCESDSECSQLYESEYVWNGRTLGGQCSNGQIMMYGCEPTGQDICVEKDILPSGEEICLETAERKSCDLVKRITTGIQCCTSDDCQGVGDYYCEWIDDFNSKCSLKAQCQKDSDCGTATKCDINTKSIIETYCNENDQCDTKTLQIVECCSDKQCDPNYFCSRDYKCELLSRAPKSSCSDGIQNQGEEGVDCGGPCQTQCSGGDSYIPDKITPMIVVDPSSILAIIGVGGIGIAAIVIYLRRKPKASVGSTDDLDDEEF